MSLAAVLSLVAAQLLHLTMPLWAVLTAIVVTQISAGKSLQATMDYLSGTAGGAVFAVAIALCLPHDSEPALLGTLAVAVAPLALLAAWRHNFSMAPATAVIVILLPTMSQTSATASAIDRVLEAALGGAVGVAVSFLLPSWETSNPQA